MGRYISLILCLLCVFAAFGSCDADMGGTAEETSGAEMPIVIDDIYAKLNVTGTKVSYDYVYGARSVSVELQFVSAGEHIGTAIITPERGYLSDCRQPTYDITETTSYEHYALYAGDYMSGSVLWFPGNDDAGTSYIRAVFYSEEKIIGFAIVKVEYEPERLLEEEYIYSQISSRPSFTESVTAEVVYQCLISGADEDHPVTDEYINARTEEIIGRAWEGPSVGYDEFFERFGDAVPAPDAVPDELPEE